MSELHELTLLEQAAAVRRRQVSPVQLTEHYLARIERYGEPLGAFVTVTAQHALAQARAAEAAVLAAREPTELPPLLGVPVPVKDLHPVAGVRCTFGSAAYAEFVPDFDDAAAARLRAAGTVLLGKTTTPEFGLSCYTESAVAPPARTPWDPGRSAGGSSGGAAAAVAARLAPAAQGSDGGGSVRIPASACGLVGLKPTRGRIGPGPRGGDVSGLPTSGPLARTVADAAALLDAMVGSVPGDPYPLPALPAGESFLRAVRSGPGRLRVGCWREPVLAHTVVHPEVLAAYDQAATLLVELGHDVQETSVPFGPELVPAFEAVWAVLAAMAPVAAPDEELLLPLTRWMRGRAATVSGVAYASALAGLQGAARVAGSAWAAYDVLLCPTLAQPPAPVGGQRDDADPAGDFERQKAFSPYCATYNVTGQPAISLPLHWSPATQAQPSLPIGVMIAARHGQEAQLLALAGQLEAARPWVHREPPALPGISSG